MDKRAGKYPGDNLGVTMGMVRVSGAYAYQVVIVDHHATEGDIRRIVVFAEREAVIRLGPIRPGEESLLCPTQLDIRSDPWRAHCFSIAGR